MLFVNHTSTISGAELILLDVAAAFPGASAFLFEPGPLADGLRRRGLDVIVSQNGSGMSGLKRDASLLKAIPLAGRLSRLLGELIARTRQHDVVYANSQKAFVLSALATAVSRRPLVWHLHDIISAAHFGGGQRRLQVTLANTRAARVIVPSRASADAFVAAGGRPDLVTVVPNGLDLEPERATRAELRDRLGLPRGRLVGVFSRLAPWKGQHVVIEALAKLRGVDVIIAGDALFGEAPYASQLRKLASDLGIMDRVHFLGSRRDVPTLMRTCDVVVHSSVDAEPFGRTLVEAMLARTPLVATDAGASAEILQSGACGRLIPPSDATAMATAIESTFADPEASAQVDRAEKRAREHYNVTAMRSGVADVVASVAAGCVS